MEHSFDFSQITPLIYIGQNTCCKTHFDASLLSLGVRADISLEQERLDHPFGVDVFLWLPTKDKTAIANTQAQIGIDTLHRLEKEGVPCYVHCKNGHGRAPTLVAAFFMDRDGISADDAIARIKQKRPAIHLEDAQRAFLLSRET